MTLSGNQFVINGTFEDPPGSRNTLKCTSQKIIVGFRDPVISCEMRHISGEIVQFRLAIPPIVHCFRAKYKGVDHVTPCNVD